MHWLPILILTLAPAPEMPTTDQIKAYLPDAVGDWRLGDGPTRHDLKTVYDYMDGAIDPYRRYAFEQLFVASYHNGDGRIIAELYDMTTPQEAYGCSTTDLTGEPVGVATGGLYDYGAVRFRRDRYVIRVYDDAGGDANREGVLAVAKAVSDRIRDEGTLPVLVERFSKLPLSAKNIRYFHEMENLNDVYYISTDNVLLMSEKTEAVMADCAIAGKPLKVVLIRYPDKSLRAKALSTFREKALTEKAVVEGDGMIHEQIEEAVCWAIKPMDGREKDIWLVLCLEAADLDQCRKAIAAVAVLKPKSGEG